MSTHDPHYAHANIVVRETNGIAVWGFTFSLLGITCCPIFLVSALGLILSLVGLGKQPRGFAIAGLILGLIGTVGGLAVVKRYGKPYSRIIWQSGGMELPTFTSMREAERRVLTKRSRTGKLPPTLDDVTDGALTFTDQWGTSLGYRVSTDGDGYSLHSAGKDTVWGTGDELSYTVLDYRDADEFITSRGTVSLIDANTLPYTPEQLENAPVPDEQLGDPTPEHGG